MKNIAIINYHMACGGTEKALVALLKSLDYSKVKVKLFCLYLEGDMINEIPKEVEVELIQFDKSWKRYCASGGIPYFSWHLLFAKCIRKVYKLIHKVGDNRVKLNQILLEKIDDYKEKFDVVLDFYGYGAFTSAWAMNKLKTQKYCMWIHDERCEWMERVEPWLDRVDYFYGVSEAAKNNFVAKYPRYEAKAKVLYNLIDAEEIIEKGKQHVSYNVTKPLFVTVGRVVDQKGYDIAVEAAKMLKDRKIDFEWLFLGDGEKKKSIEELIEKNGLNGNIKMLGMVLNPYPYMKLATIYIQPSRHEGYPVVLVEARALKCPILASDIPSVREQIEDGINGYLFTLDKTELANNIEDLLKNRSKLDKVKSYLENQTIDYSGEIDKLYCDIGVD